VSRLCNIIIPVHNGLSDTITCVESIYRNCNKEIFDLTIISNNSRDGTDKWCEALKDSKNNVKFIKNQINKGFSGACNQGIQASDGKYVLFLNNDTISTPNFLMQLLDCIKNAHQITKVGPIGLVGPSSNLVAGRQQVPQSQGAFFCLDQYAKEFYQKNFQNWYYTGFLSFFCVLIDRKVINNVGLLDEQFFPGGFDDNDYIIRVAQKGWKAVGCGDTFVWHHGHKTFDAEFPEAKRGLANRDKFYNKFSTESKKQKVVAMYRVKNAAAYFEESLNSVAPLVDEIIVLDDGSQDGTYEIARNHSKVVKLEHQKLSLNEARDRDQLLHWAQERNPDWILVIDGDEVLSDGWTEKNFQRLIHPINPMIQAYIFRYSTFWNFKDYTRGDNVWKGMQNIRLFRNLPETHIISDHPVGFHCNSTPPIPPENVFFAPVSMRIKHYGYLDKEDRERKFKWYETVDTQKNVRAIGANNYKHLVSEAGLHLRRWIPKNTLALNMIIKDEEPILESFFEFIYTIFDEIVIVDTGSIDKSRDICMKYGAKVHDGIQFTNPETGLLNDFSAARNFAKEQTKSHWILHLDPDELLPSATVQNLSLMTEEDVTGYLFTVINRHTDGGKSISEALRLFRNIPEIYYTGYVHETFDTCKENIPDWTVPKTDLIIVHNGYMKGHRRVEEKLQHYDQLNRKQMEDFPDDPRPVYNLAMHYVNNDLMNQAVELFLKARSLDEKFFSPRHQLAVYHLWRSKNYFEEILKCLPSEHPHFTRAKEALDWIHSQIGNYPWKEGQAALNQGLIKDAS